MIRINCIERRARIKMESAQIGNETIVMTEPVSFFETYIINFGEVVKWK